MAVSKTLHISIHTQTQSLLNFLDYSLQYSHLNHTSDQAQIKAHDTCFLFKGIHNEPETNVLELSQRQRTLNGKCMEWE